MNIQDTSAVLAKAKLVDNREVSELIIMEWHDIIGHLYFPDAIAAVTFHRKEQPGVYLEPGHVIKGAARARDLRERDERIRRQLEPVPVKQPMPDKAELDRITQAALETARAERAAKTENRSK